MPPKMHHIFSKLFLALWIYLAIMGGVIAQAQILDSDWPQYGGSDGGLRYAPYSQINVDNVSKLEVAWIYRTGELERRSKEMNVNSSNENTPIIVNGRLIVCTPFNRIIALDPNTGKEEWVFDPNVSTTMPLPNQYVCRGVSQWIDKNASTNEKCNHRIFIPVNDLRIIAIDANDGSRCQSFGENGAVVLDQERSPEVEGEIRLNSPPAIVNDVIVVGSTIVDGVRTDAPYGTVRGLDVRTGQEIWQFDPIPKSENIGGANVWTAMAVDQERDLVFLPTSSPSPDFHGGNRKGDTKWGNSLVALKGETGELVWGQQLVRHDIWDYDLPSQPTLIEIDENGDKVPAVVQTTKQGFVFAFNRETGVPIFPLEEIPVPSTNAQNESVPQSQPIPSKPPSLLPAKLSPSDAYGFTPFDRRGCRTDIEKYNNEGVFTPVSENGTIFYPSTAGGANWGGSSFDSDRRLLFVNTSRVAQIITLIKKQDSNEAGAVSLSSKDDVSPHKGTPYKVKREWLLSSLGAPCSPPPWGGLTAIDMDKGKIVWDVPLGSISESVNKYAVLIVAAAIILGGIIAKLAASLVFAGMNRYEPSKDAVASSLTKGKPFTRVVFWGLWLIFILMGLKQIGVGGDRLPVPKLVKTNLGTPNIGGPVATKSGLIFIAAAQDNFLRAFKSDTGEEVWKDKLPAGGQTTPMSFMSNGKQYVVITSGQHLWFGTPPGDYVVAYALPDNLTNKKQ